MCLQVRYRFKSQGKTLNLRWPTQHHHFNLSTIYVRLVGKTIWDCVREGFLVASGVVCRTPLLVATLIGHSIPINHVISSIEIQVGDDIFPIDLILLDLLDFNIILGMD